MEMTSVTTGTTQTRWAKTAVCQESWRPSALNQRSSARPEHRLREEDRQQHELLVERAAAPVVAGEGERAEEGDARPRSTVTTERDR